MKAVGGWTARPRGDGAYGTAPSRLVIFGQSHSFFGGGEHGFASHLSRELNRELCRLSARLSLVAGVSQKAMGWARFRQNRATVQRSGLAEED